MSRASSSPAACGYRWAATRGFAGERGKLGKKKNKLLGDSPKKTLRPALFDSAKEAELALAQLREVLELGLQELRAPKMAAPPAGSAVAQRPVFGGAPGELLQRRADNLRVRAVLLSPQQAAAAAARGEAEANADNL